MNFDYSKFLIDIKNAILNVAENLKVEQQSSNAGRVQYSHTIPYFQSEIARSSDDILHCKIDGYMEQGEIRQALIFDSFLLGMSREYKLPSDNVNCVMSFQYDESTNEVVLFAYALEKCEANKIRIHYKFY